MQLQKASRKKAKIKMALQGPSGSGKTYGALLIAFGLCGSWEKIAVIDTENSSSNLYSHLGEYLTLDIGMPYSPEKYIQAIKLCEQSKMEVIILDSVSHEWDGIGGILDIHANMTGNSFTNWGKLTPRHNAFVQAMLQSPAHILVTIRSKQDYVLNEKNGKMVPEKVGLKGVQRDGLDYEFTIVLDVDSKHNAIASKDRTNLFISKPEFQISTDTGRLINEWCNEGEHITNPVISAIHHENGFITDTVIPESELIQQIDSCQTVDQLLAIYYNNPLYQDSHLEHFSKRRKELQPSLNPNSFTLKLSSNGTTAI